MKIFLRVVVVLSFVFVIYAHLWQKVQILRLGYRISESEGEKELLEKECRNLWLDISRLKAVKRVEGVPDMRFPDELEVVELVSDGKKDKK